MDYKFWEKFKSRRFPVGIPTKASGKNKPFYCLAPMSDVTDSAFRLIISKYGKPDVMWTEFISADGLVSAGKKNLLHILKFSEKERPIVAQIFSANPEKIGEAVKIIKKLGFDGVDINMGCPDRTVIKQGAGSALIKTPELAKKIIRSAKKSAGEMPVSVKTRIGFNKDEIEMWIPAILEENISALTIHGRTKKEMSLVPADWKKIKKVVALRNKISPRTLIIGNGDVKDLTDAKKKAKESGCDGIMFGRAFFGNPWLCNPSAKLRTSSEKLKVLVEHTKLFEKMLGKHKSFAVMKKHFKAYINGFDGAKELRVKLMETNNAKQVVKIIGDYLIATKKR